MRAAILLLVSCLAVASAQTASYSSLADAVRAANASAPNLSILLAAVQVSLRFVTIKRDMHPQRTNPLNQKVQGSWKWQPQEMELSLNPFGVAAEQLAPTCTTAAACGAAAAATCPSCLTNQQPYCCCLTLLQAAGVGSALGPNTTWTILAPDNAAFTSRLNESLGITPQQLLLPENRETLVQVGCLLRAKSFARRVEVTVLCLCHHLSAAHSSLLPTVGYCCCSCWRCTLLLCCLCRCCPTT
jgi:hypothetical protein